MLSFPAIGLWSPGQIVATWTASTRPAVAEVEQQIERAWREAMSRPGIQLFDGPMCRLEDLQILAGGKMHLTLSRTSYKPFLGTNLSNATDLAKRYGPKVLANPVGLSCLLVSDDGLLMLGRRNASVAYYPSRIHPFAGSLEPAENLDVFDEVFRELREELALGKDDIARIVCTGIAQDQALRQPEMIFAACSKLTCMQIESQLDPDEHLGVWTCAATSSAVDEALRTQLSQFTPVAAAAILLWGRTAFGEQWFREAVLRTAAK